MEIESLWKTQTANTVIGPVIIVEMTNYCWKACHLLRISKTDFKRKFCLSGPVTSHAVTIKQLMCWTSDDIPTRNIHGAVSQSHNNTLTGNGNGETCSTRMCGVCMGDTDDAYREEGRRKNCQGQMVWNMIENRHSIHSTNSASNTIDDD